MRTYKIQNWPQYNKSLIQRGSINLWFSEEAIKKWYSTSHTKKGRSLVYSDDAILCALLIRTVFHLSLRALQGFLVSMIALLGLTIKSPSDTQISRRSQELGKALSKLSNCWPHDMVFDSIGLKVYGEGEWKVRQHGISKRRTWRKLHIGMDLDSWEIIIAELSDNGVGSGNGETAKELIKKIPKNIERVFGDAALEKE